MPVDIDQLRERLDLLHADQARRRYHRLIGRQPTPDSSSLSIDGQGLLRPETVHQLLADQAITHHPAEVERLRCLALGVTQAYLAQQLAPLRERLDGAASGILMRHHESGVASRRPADAVAEEPDRQQRRHLDASYMTATAQLNPCRAQLAAKSHEVTEGLGLGDYLACYDRLTGVALPALAEVAQGILDRTRQLYFDSVGPWVESAIGVPLLQAEQHDAAHLFDLPAHHRLLPAAALPGAVQGTLLGLDAAIEEMPGLVLGAAEGPDTPGRSVCIAARIPHEVYLLLRPKAGHAAYRRALRAVGAAVHALHVAAEYPLEVRTLGDASVPSAYAACVENLLLEPGWLEDAVGVDTTTAAVVAQQGHILHLHRVRRVATLLLYQIELHAAGPAALPAMAERYALACTEQLGFRYRAEPYLDCLEPVPGAPAFAAAMQLRAWMLAAVLRERWQARHGERWWRPGGAADELHALWAVGGTIPAHGLAVAMGLPGLLPDALERQISEGIRLGYAPPQGWTSSAPERVPPERVVCRAGQEGHH